MCICGWQLVALACLLPFLVVVYGAVDGQIASLIRQDIKPRHRGGESANSPASTKPIRF